MSKQIYIKYAKDVVSGKQVAGEFIKLACQRFLDWFDRDDIYFDKKKVDHVISFIGKMKHSTGIHARKPFTLLPWQQWIVANIFGWKYKDTGLRVTNKVYIEVSRKNGKSAFASALSIYCSIADNEPNAEIELVANSRKQAHITFDMCSNFSESLDPKKKLFKRQRDSISIPLTKSVIQVLSSDAMGNDGYNSHCFILDEMHAMRSWDLYNVMKSSQGMRTQPLAIVITTAGFLLDSYPCYEYRKMCVEILRNLKNDDTQFCAIYEMDEGDDYKDESNWIKCTPSLGQTVTKKYLRDQVKEAENNPAIEVGVKTKNFNIFCQTSETWISNKYITNSTGVIDLSKFKDGSAYIGVDLGSVSDLTAVSLLIPYENKYYYKTMCFVPEETLESSVNGELYKEWARNGDLILTHGNVTDYSIITNYIMKISEQIPIINIAYDPYNATQWAIDCTDLGLPMQPHAQGLGSFNRPTKELQRLIMSGKVVMDNNPCVRWQFNNVVIKSDWNENIKPTKATNENKIDGVVAMIMALGGYLDVNHPNQQIIGLSM